MWVAFAREFGLPQGCPSFQGATLPSEVEREFSNAWLKRAARKPATLRPCVEWNVTPQLCRRVLHRGKDPGVSMQRFRKKEGPLPNARASPGLGRAKNPPRKNRAREAG